MTTFTPGISEPTYGYIREDERAWLYEIKGALQKLVDRLDEIHADPAYKSVWTVSQLHVGPYEGPNYVEELRAARRALIGKIG